MYEKSAECYEKAVNDETFKLYRIPFQVDVLLSLAISYREINEQQKACEIGDRLWDMFPSMCNQTSSVVYSYMYVYRRYVDNLCELEEATAELEEKMIESITEFGKEHDNFTNLVAYQLTKHHYERGNFRKAIKVAPFAIEALEYSENGKQCMSHMKAELYMILGRSTYFLKNFTQAEKWFVQTMDFMLLHNLTLLHARNFSTCCLYLVCMNNFQYLRTCYSSIFYELLKEICACIFYVLYMVLVVPSHSNTVSKPESVLPVSVFPEVTQFSKLTSMLPVDKYSLANVFEQIFNIEPDFDFLSFLNKLFNIFISSRLVLFLLSVVSVFLRITAIYLLFCVLYRCFKYFSDIGILFFLPITIFIIIGCAFTYYNLC